MYSSIRVKGLRCFDDLQLNDLALVNLVVGQNNVGKTTLLEAVFLHSGQTNPELAFRLQRYRGMEGPYQFGTEAPWNVLFHQLDRSRLLEISGVDTESKSRVVRLTAMDEDASTRELGEGDSSYVREPRLELTFIDGKQQSRYKLVLKEGNLEVDEHPPPAYRCIFVFARERAGGGADDAQRFSSLSVHRQVDPVIDAMKIVEPRLVNLTVNVYLGLPTIFADIGLPQLLPIQVLGDGLRRVLSIMTSISVCRGGVVLVDELDAGLHHSILTPFWKAIFVLASRLDVQVFATTHSHECLLAARKAATEFTADLFRMHRLDRVGDRIEAVTYDREALDGAIAADLEVR